MPGTINLKVFMLPYIYEYDISIMYITTFQVYPVDGELASPPAGESQAGGPRDGGNVHLTQPAR